MNKLTIEHLAPYLPYGVYVYHEDQESKTDLVIGVYNNTIDFETWSPVRPYLDEYKLVLRPLSDLTREIEHDGEKFVPIEYLKEHAVCDAERDYLDYAEKNITRNPEKTKFGPYRVIQKFFEWHFDVFGLIDKGLAIDINTLNQ
jgi:hypothetical protein